MPISQRGVGRDHNPNSFSFWMSAPESRRSDHRRKRRVRLQSNQATCQCFRFPCYRLHLMGIDHKRLTYLFNGRNMRLTDVHGELIPQIAGNRSTTERTG